VKPSKKQRKKQKKVGKAKVEPQTMRIAAVTPNHITPRAGQRFRDKVTFASCHNKTASSTTAGTIL